MLFRSCHLQFLFLRFVREIWILSGRCQGNVREFWRSLLLWTLLIIVSGSDVSSTTESVTQCNTDVKAPIIDWSYYDLNSDFLPRIASATVLLLCHTPPAASQTTHCHGYGYCWLWRYKGDCVIVKGHVACIVLWCRPKHSVDVDAPEKNGLGLSRAICVNDVDRNKNILPMVALDEYHDTGLLQNADCILLNRRYSRHFD